ELLLQYPLIETTDTYTQKIIKNNITVFRAYANGYHWLKNKHYDITSRNLGYYGQIQSELATKFKALVIDWMSDTNNAKRISKEMIASMGIRLAAHDPVREFINRLAKDVNTTSNGVTELIVLSKINKDMPVIIKNDLNRLL